MVYPVTCKNQVISYQALEALRYRDFGKAVLDVCSRNFPETVVLRNPIQRSWMYSSSTGIGYPPSRRLVHDVPVDPRQNHMVFTTRIPPSYTVLAIILSARECAREAGSWTVGVWCGDQFRIICQKCISLAAAVAPHRVRWSTKTANPFAVS